MTRLVAQSTPISPISEDLGKVLPFLGEVIFLWALMSPSVSGAHWDPEGVTLLHRHRSDRKDQQLPLGCGEQAGTSMPHNADSTAHAQGWVGQGP